MEGQRLKLLIPIEDVKNKRDKVPFQCACGDVSWKRPQDVIEGQQKECKSCTSRTRMKREMYEGSPALEQLRKNAAAMKGVLKKSPEWTRLRHICQGAKNRCCNPDDRNYKNYGGRGIKFGFDSASAMAEWIIENLGYPKEGDSIDRIDNDKGYEVGNLRWADRTTQANNKRDYKRTPEGERLRRLEKLKPEFCYERLREFVKQGLTDEEIIARERTTSGRPRRESV